jgi:hypothetical protein
LALCMGLPGARASLTAPQLTGRTCAAPPAPAGRPPPDARLHAPPGHRPAPRAAEQVAAPHARGARPSPPDSLSWREQRTNKERSPASPGFLPTADAAGDFAHLLPVRAPRGVTRGAWRGARHTCTGREKHARAARWKRVRCRSARIARRTRAVPSSPATARRIAAVQSRQATLAHGGAREAARWTRARWARRWSSAGARAGRAVRAGTI